MNISDQRCSVPINSLSPASFEKQPSVGPVIKMNIAFVLQFYKMNREEYREPAFERLLIVFISICPQKRHTRMT